MMLVHSVRSCQLDHASAYLMLKKKVSFESVASLEAELDSGLGMSPLRRSHLAKLQIRK